MNNTDKISAKLSQIQAIEAHYPQRPLGSGKKYFVTFPYPYMNGKLHLGHLFTLSKAEFIARYKAITGFDVLFPIAFHCTGMPISASAERLCAELQSLENIGRSSCEKEAENTFNDLKHRNTDEIDANNVEPPTSSASNCPPDNTGSMYPNILYNQSDYTKKTSNEIGVCKNSNGYVLPDSSNPELDNNRVPFDTENKRDSFSANIKPSVSLSASSVSSILMSFGFNSSEIPLFRDPNHWLTVFPVLCKNTLENFHSAIDFSKSFITTSRNFYYDAFIRWQFSKLLGIGAISFGKRFTIYDPLTSQPCLDHDRATGEGVMPMCVDLCRVRIFLNIEDNISSYSDAHESLTERCYDLNPTGLPNISNNRTVRSKTSTENLSDSKHKIQRTSLGTATPEDIENIPNKTGVDPCTPIKSRFPVSVCFLTGNEKKFVVFEYKNEVFVVPRKAYCNLQHQCKNLSFKGELDLSKFEASSGCKGLLEATAEVMDAQRVDFTHSEILTNKDQSGCENNSESYNSENLHNIPDRTDQELQKVKKMNTLRKPASIKEGVLTDFFSLGDLSLKILKAETEYLNSMEPDDTKLETTHNLLRYYKPQSEIKSRSGAKCVVSLTDQWFINYKDPALKTKAVQCVENMENLTRDTKKELLLAIDWINKWGVSRTFGLGTRIPFDERYVIDSLSDSTIYMMFYTIKDLLFYDTEGLCEIVPKKYINSSFFDAIINGSKYHFDERSNLPRADLDIDKNGRIVSQKEPSGKQISEQFRSKEKEPSGKQISEQFRSKEKEPSGKQMSEQCRSKEKEPSGKQISEQFRSKEKEPSGKQISEQFRSKEKEPSGKQMSEHCHPEENTPKNSRMDSRSHKDELKFVLEVIERAKKRLEYFYPVDLRVSGKDLTKNHLIFYIMNHCLLFPQEMWPKRIFTNGHLMLNNEKMSKSTGNFMTADDCIQRYGVSCTRLCLAQAGDNNEDANFVEDVASGFITRLSSLIASCDSFAGIFDNLISRTNKAEKIRKFRVENEILRNIHDRGVEDRKAQNQAVRDPPQGANTAPIPQRKSESNFQKSTKENDQSNSAANTFEQKSTKERDQSNNGCKDHRPHSGANQCENFDIQQIASKIETKFKKLTLEEKAIINKFKSIKESKAQKLKKDEFPTNGTIPEKLSFITKQQKKIERQFSKNDFSRRNIKKGTTVFNNTTYLEEYLKEAIYNNMNRCLDAYENLKFMEVIKYGLFEMLNAREMFCMLNKEPSEMMGFWYCALSTMLYPIIPSFINGLSQEYRFIRRIEFKRHNSDFQTLRDIEWVKKIIKNIKFKVKKKKHIKKITLGISDKYSDLKLRLIECNGNLERINQEIHGCDKSEQARLRLFAMDYFNNKENYSRIDERKALDACNEYLNSLFKCEIEVKDDERGEPLNPHIEIC